jgi:zinc protease
MSLNKEGVCSFDLENNLKVYFKRVPNCGVVAIDVWYNFGGIDKVHGKTGAAHLLEHLAFQGIMPNFDQKMARKGCNINACTTRTHTVFSTQLPSSEIDFILGVEAKRMRGLSFSKKSFEKEKLIVAQEIKDYESDILCDFYEKATSLFYNGHPYGLPIVGIEKDIQDLTIDEIRSAYWDYYAPSNASIVVVGDLSLLDVQSMVKKHFSEFKAERTTYVDGLDKDDRLTGFNFQTTEVLSNGIFAIFVPTVSAIRTEEHELHLLASYLCSGENSVLYNKLVATGLLEYIDANQISYRNSGHFSITGRLMPNVEFEKVYDIIFDEINTLRKVPFSDRELELTKQRYLSSYLFGNERCEDFAWEIGEQTQVGDCLYDVVDNIEDITSDTLIRAIECFFSEKDYFVSVLRPTEESKTPLKCIERSVPPVKESVLSNGLKVITVKNDAPFVSMSLKRSGLTLFDDIKPGLANLASCFLSEGNQEKTKTQMHNILDERGMKMMSIIGGLYGRCLNGDISPLLRIMSECVRYPKIHNFDRLKESMIVSAKSREDMPSYLSNRLFDEYLLGDYAKRDNTMGSSEQIKDITYDDCDNFLKTDISPGRTTLIVVGNVEHDEIVDLANLYLEPWMMLEALRSIPKKIKDKKAKEVKVNVPHEKLHVTLGHLGISRLSENYLPMTLFDHVFGAGGGLSDRLMTKLRGENALCYSAYGSITDSACFAPGTFKISVSCNPEDYSKVIDIIRKELIDLKENGITRAEFNMARDKSINEVPLNYETSSQWLSYIYYCNLYGFPYSKVYDDVKKLGKIKLKDVNKVISECIFPYKLSVFSVGNTANII